MKILLIDDSRSMRLIIKQCLIQAGFAGLTVEEAANGREALTKISEARPDLLIVDWNMPEMNGAQLLESLKQQDVVIDFGFITSEGTRDMQLKAEQLGAKFFITKPFTLDNIKSTLTPILSAS